MRLLGLLLRKDLARAWRNPLPWLINLLIPVCIAGLLGAAFGGRSGGEVLGRIRFAVVDEDKSALMDFLKGAMNQREAGEHLEPVFLERAEAMSELEAGRLSAVLVLPEGFMRNYLTGEAVVRLELVKNPSQAWHPAVLEEVLGVAVTALNTLRRTVGAELGQWLPVFEGEADHRRLAELIVQVGDKFERVSRYVDPPLLQPETEERLAAGEGGRGVNLFAYMLVGLVAMFMLFVAATSLIDVLREQANGTLARYHTLRDSLVPFLASKVASAWVILLCGCAVTLGGGGLVFRMTWQRPGALVWLGAAYCLFACGFMALVVALARTQQRADVVCNLTGMVLGLAGGCAFPVQQLPAFIREHISPWMPPYWFAEAVRNLEFGDGSTSWVGWGLLMGGLGLGLMGVAAWMLRRRLEAGVRT